MHVSYITSPTPLMAPLEQSKVLLNQGMKNHQLLARIAVENFTNAKTTGASPQDLPYRRKVVNFKDIKVAPDLTISTPQHVSRDPSPYNVVYKPQHPAADEKGYVRFPNIDEAMEMLDFRSAIQSLHALAQIYSTATAMETRNHELMKKI